LTARHPDDVAPPLARDLDRQASAFGLSLGGWHHIVRRSIKWSERDQAFRLLYDRSITTAYHLYRYYSTSLWPFWRHIQVSILIVVGGKSNVLPLELAQEMLRQNPRARCLSVPDVGHMPMQSDEIAPVVQFLIE
jgi:pimeloyl-ACP methyl ester carboxylesterase